MSGPLGSAGSFRPWNSWRDNQRRQLWPPKLQRVRRRHHTAVPCCKRPDSDKPTGPSSAIGPFGLVVDVANNAAAAVGFATPDSREFAELDVVAGDIAQLVDSVVRSP